MEDLAIYFTKSTGILLLFLGLYFLVLRSETFFKENRFFLLIGMLISLVLPFLVITKYIEIPVMSSETTGTFTYTTNGIPIEASISWTSILLYTYIAGVIFFFCKFLIELFSLFRLLWKSNVAKRDAEFIYIETNASFSPFSFFNYIVYNPKLYSTSELEAILKHEQAHSRQLHSVDVFVSKLYCIFLWFNPFAWLHKKFMLQNLEFLADKAAIQETPSKKEYQLTLLKVSGNSYCPALTNNFYNSLIKKRIVMLQKTQSTHVNRWKQALIVPLLIAFVFLFNTEIIAKEITTTTPTPVIETITGPNNTIGDLVVVITKNTTVDELKAYKKLFKSQKIKFEYSDVNFNLKGEISSIALVLTSKNTEAANGKFATIDDKAISDIQLGKRGDELFIKSKAFEKTVTRKYTFKVDSEYNEDDSDVKTIDIRNENGKEIIIVNGKKLSDDEVKKYHKNKSIHTYTFTTDDKTVDVKNINGEKRIFINGKEVSSDKLQKANTTVYTFTSDDDKKEQTGTFKVVKDKNAKIVFNSTNSKNKPLYIVDGKEVSNGDFTKLDSDDIESVSVLKGENATALYGEKGENGVILVTTKKKK
ncbi:MAG: M56 family metallopeptidase [Kordia sp.]|uniref:M56 family metallopeptidase n=1 Tax=Kordia sp. TaxID=1965332 RepID=UPI00385D3C8D